MHDPSVRPQPAAVLSMRTEGIMHQVSKGRHYGGGSIGQTSKHRGVTVIIIIIIIIVILITKIIIITTIWEAAEKKWMHLGGIQRHLEISGGILDTAESSGGICEASGTIIWKHLGGIWRHWKHLGTSGRHLGAMWEAWALKVPPRWSESSEIPKKLYHFQLKSTCSPSKVKRIESLKMQSILYPWNESRRSLGRLATRHDDRLHYQNRQNPYNWKLIDE